MPQTLRPYQLAAVADLRAAIKAGRRAIVLVAPTGSGKTSIAAHMIEAAIGKGKAVMFLAHRRELIDQCGARLDDLGIDHGVIQADHPRRRPWLPVQVASVPTLARRLKDGQARMVHAGNTVDTDHGTATAPAWKAHTAKAGQAPDLIFIDECHRARAHSYQKILAAHPQAVCIGLTATPCRQDGLGLGELFDAMVSCPSVNALTRMGYLVPSRVYAPAKPDVSQVAHDRKTGDYATGALAEVMDRQVLVGDIVQHWLRLARMETDVAVSGERADSIRHLRPGEENKAGSRNGNGGICWSLAEDGSIDPGIPGRPRAHPAHRFRPTVCFAVSVAHSRHIVGQFQAAGVAAEHLDGETPAADRKRILEDLATGKLDLVSNCEVLTEGWDCPTVSCAILARPTESLGLYLQMVGRILRPAMGKPDALIIDHSGMVHRHGFPDDDREWVLAGDREYRRDATDKTPGVKICPQCFLAMRAKVRECPNCGTAPPLQDRIVVQVDGELREETGGRASECILCGCRHGEKWKCLTCGGDMLPVPRRVRMGVAV